MILCKIMQLKLFLDPSLRKLIQQNWSSLGKQIEQKQLKQDQAEHALVA